MSKNPQNSGTRMPEELVRELRQSYGLAASFFRAAAGRIGMTDTDMQVIDLLESSGEATAGQLATLMGLTTGTFTAILNRLEKAGLVRRERDPTDGRRVIVKLATHADGKQDSPLFASLGNAWEELAGHYDDEQKALLLEFLQRSNTLAREEIARLRGETSVGDEGSFSAPLVNQQSARLVVHAEGVELTLRAGEIENKLYQARFEGPVPDVKVSDAVVTIRYPKLPWLSRKEKRIAEVMLSTAIPWQFALNGGGSLMIADLRGLDLLTLETNGAGSSFRIELPEPKRAVPVRLGGSGSEVIVQRPSGVAARVQQKGWGSGIVFDNQTVSEWSSDGRLQSPNYEGATLRYDIETSGSGSMFTITTD